MNDYLFCVNVYIHELLRLIDEGHNISIEEVCRHIDNGDICRFLQVKFGYKNLNINKEMEENLEILLMEKYVSDNEAAKWAITKNGLLYIVEILVSDLIGCMYNIKNNMNLKLESYRNY